MKCGLNNHIGLLQQCIFIRQVHLSIINLDVHAIASHQQYLIIFMPFTEVTFPHLLELLSGVMHGCIKACQPRGQIIIIIKILKHGFAFSVISDISNVGGCGHSGKHAGVGQKNSHIYAHTL